MERRLVAIMVGDVVGFSAMMEADEDRTTAQMRACRDIVDAELARNEGRLFKAMGDAVLAEFPRPVSAVRCAVAIRDALAASQVAEENPLRMRFGIHLADVAVEDGDLIGHGVNLAARLQQDAEPGAIDVSSAIFEQIRRGSPFAFEDVGEKTFRNLDEPVRVFRLRGDLGRHRYQVAPTRPDPRVAKRPHSVAVMPIETSEGQDDKHFLAAGLAEELIFELGRFKKLFVSSLSATQALEGEKLDPRKIGEQLGVRYVLNGSMRQLGNRIRLSISLIETETGSVVWTDRLNEDLDTLVDAFDGLVSRIASTVLGRVVEADIAATRRLKPESMTAYELHLRGLEYHRLGGVTDDNLREAVRWFERAIEADPNFARPRALWVCARSGYPGWTWEDLQARTQRALELDPNDPEGNRVMGSILLYTGQIEASRRYHEKAMALSPSDAYIKSRTASFFVFTGEAEKALALLDEAEALDPFLPVWCVEERVAALYVLGRYEESIEAAQGLTFQTRRSRLYTAACLIALGRQADARRVIADALVSAPDLDANFIAQSELYTNPEVKRLLIDRVVEAGLPRFGVAIAS